MGEVVQLFRKYQKHVTQYEDTGTERVNSPPLPKGGYKK
jgi:hypothetical protein